MILMMTQTLHPLRARRGICLGPLTQSMALWYSPNLCSHTLSVWSR